MNHLLKRSDLTGPQIIQILDLADQLKYEKKHGIAHDHRLKGKTLGELVRDRMAAFPASGEINSKLAQPVEAINRVEQHFSREALAVDRTDGISMTFADWRFNLRSSNTEPVVRLNVESRGDVPLMEERTRTLLTLLNE